MYLGSGIVSWGHGEFYGTNSLPVAPGWHYIGLSVSPTEARMMVDGGAVGVTAVTSPGLPSGAVTLVLGKYFAGFGDNSISVDDSISFRGFAAALAPAKWPRSIP